MHDTHNAYIAGVTGVLLAGGKSRRMGYDKARIKVAGQYLLSSALELLLQHFSKVLIAGNRPDLMTTDVPAIPDIYPGSALGGLYTGLITAETDWIFVAPCDMPYPDSRILKLLLNHREGYDAVVPRTPKGYEPLFALYHKRCLTHMEVMLKQNRFRIYDFYHYINIHYLEWQEMPEGWERSLLNINTPAQLEKLQKEQT